MRTIAATFVFSSLLAIAYPAHAQQKPPVRPEGLVGAEAELHWQRANGAPRNAYWIEGVSKCETNSNWKDSGKWGGGLGISIQTWKNYGGLMYAKHPAKATVAEQLVVANRIAVFGWQTRNEFLTLADKEAGKPFYRPPVGFNGWGCIKNHKYLTPYKWKRSK